MRICFGDRVRVKETAQAKRLGLSGLVGVVSGETDPSSSGVYIIGTPVSNYAVSVLFEALDENYWFTCEMLELIDHGEGLAISLDGSDKIWIRNAIGEWEEKSHN